jgi:hypothetical protein
MMTKLLVDESKLEGKIPVKLIFNDLNCQNVTLILKVKNLIFILE